MRICVFGLLVLSLSGFVVYRLLPRSVGHKISVSVAGGQNQTSLRIVYSPACVPLSPEIPSDFLFLTVRTTPVKRHSRLKALLDTWIKDAADIKSTDGRTITKIYVVADTHLRRSGQANLNDTYTTYATHCGSSVIQSQGCSLHKELSLFYAEADRARWFCHFDDDAYINVPALLLLLSQYNYTEPIYIGRRSLPNGIWAWDHLNKKHIVVDFATGQAICFSWKATALLKPLMMEPEHPWNFLELTRHHPDDITLGYIFQQYLQVPITEPQRMYIQFDDLRNLTITDIRNAVTMSYGHRNLFALPKEDATVVAKDSLSKRFHALHAYYVQEIKACEALK